VNPDTGAIELPAHDARNPGEVVFFRGADHRDTLHVRIHQRSTLLVARRRVRFSNRAVSEGTKGGPGLYAGGLE
jgi:hypothetical protein